jgi:hypothetical protein
MHAPAARSAFLRFTVSQLWRAPPLPIPDDLSCAFPRIFCPPTAPLPAPHRTTPHRRIHACTPDYPSTPARTGPRATWPGNSPASSWAVPPSPTAPVRRRTLNANSSPCTTGGSGNDLPQTPSSHHKLRPFLAQWVQEQSSLPAKTHIPLHRTALNPWIDFLGATPPIPPGSASPSSRP